MSWDINIKKGTTVLVIAVTLAVLLIVGYTQIVEKPTEEPTKVGLAWFKGGTIVAQYVAQDMGYFEDEGLEVEIAYFKSTADAIPSIVAGDLEFGMTSNTPLLKAIEAGLPIKAIGCTHYASAEEGHTSIAYVALNGSGIKNVEDLKGRRVAIPYVGGDAHIYLVALLKKHGINPDEVTPVTVPWPYQIEALVNGEVDVAGLFATHLAKMELEGINYTTVASPTDLLPWTESVVIYASTDYTEEHPDVVRRFLRAFYRGQTYLETHPEAYREYLANYTGWQPPLLEKLDIKKLHGLPHGGRFNETAWQEFIKIMVGTGFLKETIPLNRVLTEEYLPKLEEL